MLKNIIVAAVTVVVVGLGITFQVVGTESHEVKDEAPASVEQTTNSPASPAPSGDRDESKTNDESGRPGEAGKD